MQNIEQMSLALRRLFVDIGTGKADLKQATELNNTAGKVIAIAKVQLAYHALRGEVPLLPFIGGKTVVEKTNGFPVLMPEQSTKNARGRKRVTQ